MLYFVTVECDTHFFLYHFESIKEAEEFLTLLKCNFKLLHFKATAPIEAATFFAEGAYLNLLNTMGLLNDKSK